MRGSKTTEQGLHSVVEKTLPKRTAFTLAEVLIVLGIIGLIADMTIPTLHQNITEKIAVVKLKKMHSTLENAYRMAVADNGTPDNWNLIGTEDGEGATNFLNVLSKYMIVIKNCGNNESPSAQCFPDIVYKNLSGSNRYNFNTNNKLAKAVLADGTFFSVRIITPDCSANVADIPILRAVCADVGIDVNGYKPPNQTGKDLFHFRVTKQGVVPFGISVDIYSFDEHCKNSSTTDGIACSAWVIYNGNMDYLHCDDLSWDGKTKCD